MTSTTESGGVPPRAVWLILVTAFLDMVSMGLVMPVLPILIEEMTGSAANAGLWTGVMVSLWAIMQFFCAPVLGVLSDRFGRRPVILISAMGLAVSWVIMALAPNLAWLVFGRLVGGITSASATAIFAFMADITGPEQRTRAFGLVGAAISGGFIVGPAIGGALGDWDIRLPFWIAGALSALACVYGLIVLPESLKPERRASFAWSKANPFGALVLLRSHHELFRLAAGNFLLNFGFRIWSSIFVLFAAHRFGIGMFEIGMLMAVSGGLDIFMQAIITGRVAARIGETRTMQIGLFGGAIGMTAMALAPNIWLFGAAILLNGLWGLAEPTMRSLMSARVADSEQGLLQGAMHCIMSLSGIVAPLFFGWIYQRTVGTMPGFGLLIAAAAGFAATLAVLNPAKAKDTVAQKR